LIAIPSHMLLSFWIGWVSLCLLPNRLSAAEKLVTSVLLGFYLETLCTASFCLLGVPFHVAFSVTVALTVFITFLSWTTGRLRMPRVRIPRLTLLDCILVVSVAEKTVFALWQLVVTPLYFDDAMTHWSGKARAIFGAANWSIAPASPVFLGHTGTNNYPLSLPIWRATTAFLNGSWNDMVARGDGLLFFWAAIAITYLAVWRLTQRRVLAAAGALTLSVLPLEVWHISSGYADIAVQAFSLAAVAAVLRRDMFLGGVFAAATAWAKNDGLIVHVPAIIGLALLLPALPELYSVSSVLKRKTRDVAALCGGIATLAPWFIFKLVHGLAVSPNVKPLAVHYDAIAMAWRYVMTGATHGIFWMAFLVILLITARHVVCNREARALAGAFFIMLLAVLSAFIFTDAYRYLADQSAIHRSLLQMYGTAIILAALGADRFYCANADRT
jgi:hypothetical protein